MLNGKEAPLQDSASQEPELSQQELDPKVRVLWNEFMQAFKEVPEFQGNLATIFSSPGTYVIKENVHPPVSFNKGLDRWTVRCYLGEEDRTLSEYLKITVDRPSEHARGFRIVTLGIPYLSDKSKGEQEVDLSYDQRALLVYSTPTDIHYNKTASAIAGAEHILAELKRSPDS